MMGVKLSVVFFSYNRSGYLAHSLSQFIKHCQLPRSDYEIIISDDGSSEIHQTKLQKIKTDFSVEKLLVNKHSGMGHNFNTGLRAAEGKYVLHLEDDWEIQPKCGSFIGRSMAFLEHHPEVNLVRLAPLKGIDPLSDIANFGEGFHKVKNHPEMFSKNPHLKRNEFHKYFGWFNEEASPEECDSDFKKRMRSLNPKICWAGTAFSHFGCISAGGRRWGNLQDVHELLYESEENREDLLILAKSAMKNNDIHTAKHALERFQVSGECDSQILQSLEVVREMCDQAS